MPAQSIEKVKAREKSLRGKLAAAGDLEAAKRRGLKKRLRRAQRKRRRLTVTEARTAEKPAPAAE